MSIQSVVSSNHLTLCHPLLLLPSIFPRIRVFSRESALCIRWSKYWSFSFNISPPNEHPGLISFRNDLLGFLAVQGTLKSLLQHHRSKASVLRCSDFLIVQFSYLYMTTGKTIALIRWTFVGKLTSLLFNMLSRLVITFLPRSKHLLISWLQSTLRNKHKLWRYCRALNYFIWWNWRVEYYFFLENLTVVTNLSCNSTCWTLRPYHQDNINSKYKQLLLTKAEVGYSSGFSLLSFGYAITEVNFLIRKQTHLWLLLLHVDFI